MRFTIIFLFLICVPLSAHALSDDKIVCVKTRTLASDEIRLRYYLARKADARIAKYADSSVKRAEYAQSPDLCARAGITPLANESGYICTASLYPETNYVRYQRLTQTEALILAKAHAYDDYKIIRFFTDHAQCEAPSSSPVPQAEPKPEIR